MNVTRFKLGFPYYNGDLGIYVVDIDERWLNIMNFFNHVNQGTSTFDEYRQAIRKLSELAAGTDDQQAIFIGDYSWSFSSVKYHGWLIPQWSTLPGNTITKARWADSSPYDNFMDMVAPIIAAMRTTITIYYDVDGNQVQSSSDKILITVDIKGFTLDTDATEAAWPIGWNTTGKLMFCKITPDNLGIGYSFANVSSLNYSQTCFSEGNYVTCETYSFGEVISNVASAITADISKRFVQR